MPRYHFNLSPDGKLTSRATVKPVEIAPEEIADINIASATDVHNGWLTCYYDKYDAKDPEIQDSEGKWVLSFPKNDLRLNSAWRKCVSLIFNDKAVHQIKASAPSEHFDTQVILLYTKATLQDRIRVFHLLEEYELTTYTDLPIKYKTQEDTKFDTNHSEGGTRVIDQVSYMAEQVPLMEVLQKLKNHENYILNGGGRKINGKKYAESAGKIVLEIESFLSKKIDFNQADQTQLAKAECSKLIASIQKELATKTTATKGWWFFGLGARDQTTANLYSDVLNILNNDNNNASKNPLLNN